MNFCILEKEDGRVVRGSRARTHLNARKHYITSGRLLSTHQQMAEGYLWASDCLRRLGSRPDTLAGVYGLYSGACSTGYAGRQAGRRVGRQAGRQAGR